MKGTQAVNRSNLAQSKSWRQLPPIQVPVKEKNDLTKKEKVTQQDVIYRIVFESILNQDRLEALNVCDTNVISYDPYSYWMIFSVRGRNAKMILKPILFLLLWDSFFIVLFYFLPSIVTRYFIPQGSELDGGARDQADILAVDLVSPLLTPVSFLLVFRLGRAAIRFWDARSAVGKLIETCRVSASTFFVAFNLHSTEEEEDDDNKKLCDDPCFLLLNDFARYLCVFPIVVKNFLRPQNRSGWEKVSRENKKRFEIGVLLSDREADSILSTQKYFESSKYNIVDQQALNTFQQFGPITVLNKLRQIAYDFTHKHNMERENIQNHHHKAMLYRQLNEQIDTLTLAWGAMERINSTPLPFIYVVHLRTFLIIYLMLWHFQTVVILMVNATSSSNSSWYYSWYDFLPLFTATFALLGIEAAAVECERPFLWSSNHLSLGKMCVVVSNNVAQTLLNIYLQE